MRQRHREKGGKNRDNEREGGGDKVSDRVRARERERGGGGEEGRQRH